jgi:hypothetical protein
MDQAESATMKLNRAVARHEFIHESPRSYFLQLAKEVQEEGISSQFACHDPHPRMPAAVNLQNVTEGVLCPVVKWQRRTRGQKKRQTVRRMPASLAEGPRLKWRGD